MGQGRDGNVDVMLAFRLHGNVIAHQGMPAIFFSY
jgi:hypothetical protein